MSQIDKLVKEAIEGNVTLDCVMDGSLWYRTANNHLFPVPFEDTKGGTFCATEKGIRLMRWIRKYFVSTEEARKEQHEEAVPIGTVMPG
jgi:hypothetical protein